MGNSGASKANRANPLEDEQGSLSIHWIFLLSFKPASQQLAHIHPFFHTRHGWEDNLGSSFQDFEGIVQRIAAGTSPADRLRLMLVVDLPNYRSVFKSELWAELVRLEKVAAVYLFSFSAQATAEVKRLRGEDKLLDSSVDNFDEFLEQRHRELTNQEISKKMLPNFNILGLDRGQRLSDERRLKIYACLKLSSSEYGRYMEKFKTAMVRSKDVFGYRFSETFYELEAAVGELKQGRNRDFYTRMLALYQKEGNFYHVLNLYLKKCADSGFEWDQMALPISLMFYAIKLYFQDEDNRKEIDGLFNLSGECVLWRGAKFDEAELEDMRATLAMPHVYYEQVSFTSTSTSREVALRFVDRKHLRKYCLLKFVLKRPKFESEIANLDYTYLSFAKLFNRDQREVLLNSLTVCKLHSIKTSSFENVRQIYDYASKREKPLSEHLEITEIEMEVVDNLIEPFFRGSRLEEIDLSGSSLNVRQFPQSIKHYLTTADIVKTHKVFDIPLALEYSGHFQEAYRHLQCALKEELAQEKQDLRAIYHWQTRLATLLQKMERSEQALSMISSAIETCDRIQRECQATTLKEHHSLSFKLIRQSSIILQENDYYSESIEQIDRELATLQSRIENAEKSSPPSCGLKYLEEGGSKGYKFRRQAYRFHYSEYLLLRGMVNFKEGVVGQARRDVLESRRIVSEVLKDIGYESLKTETFYIQFLLHLILDDHVVWDTSDFFKLRRMQSIASATALFGGEQRIIQIKNSSAEFESQITDFIRAHEETLDQNKNLGVPPVPLMSSIEEEFLASRQPESTGGRLRVSAELEGKVKDFFDYFQSIVSANENETKRVLEGFQQEFQKLLVEQIPRDQLVTAVMTSQARLEYFRDALVHTLLADWKTTFAREETRLEIELRLDELILLKRELNFNEIEAGLEDITSEQYQAFCRESKRSIRGTFEKYESEGMHCSLMLQDKLLGRLARVHGTMGDHDKELRVCDLMIGKLGGGRKFKTLNLVAALLQKVAINFREAEIDFQHALLFRTSYKVEETRKYQRGRIDSCRRDLREARAVLKEYSNRYSGELQLQADQHNIKKGLLKKSIEIGLWELKVKVFELFLAKESPTAHKEVKSQEIELISETLHQQISEGLGKVDRDEYEAEHHEAYSFLFYVLHRFDLSLLNLKGVLAKLRISNRHRKIRVLTKLFFQFSALRREELREEERQLEVLYSHRSADPFYWRICLAYHFYFRLSKPSFFPLQRCLKQIAELPAYRFHHSLIEACELPMYKSFLSENGITSSQLSEVQRRESSTLNPQSSMESSPQAAETLFSQKDSLLQKSKELVLPIIAERNHLYHQMKKNRKTRNLPPIQKHTLQ